MKTFQEIIEAVSNKSLTSISPKATGEQNFVKRNIDGEKTTTNKPPDDAFKAGKATKVFDRKKNRMGRDTEQSIADYDKNVLNKEEFSSVLEDAAYDNRVKNAHKKKKRRHVYIDGHPIAVDNNAKSNADAIKNYKTNTLGVKKKVVVVKENEFKVGYPVHAGLSKKNGIGFIGIVTEINGDILSILIETSGQIVKSNAAVCSKLAVVSEQEQINEAIKHPNTSGQGHDKEHAKHPLHTTLEKHGYEYSHSTPIKREHFIAVGGDFKKAPNYNCHTYFHKGSGHCAGCDSDSYKWHTFQPGEADEHVHNGEGVITLNNHLTKMHKVAEASANPVIDGETVNVAHVPSNAIHAGIRAHDMNIDKEDNDEHIPHQGDNAIMAGIHVRPYKDDVVGESVVSEDHWIQKAIKKPGALTKAAKAAGESNSAYEQQHKHDSGKAGKRARLALTLNSLHKVHYKEPDPDDHVGKYDEQNITEDASRDRLKNIKDGSMKQTDAIDKKNDKVDKVKAYIKKIRDKK